MPLVDDEGLRIDSDEDEGRIDDAIAASAPLNPYANIRLERSLQPWPLVLFKQVLTATRNPRAVDSIYRFTDPPDTFQAFYVFDTYRAY